MNQEIDKTTRLRQTSRLRRFAQDVRLHPSDLVLPVFVKKGLKQSVPVSSMPDVMQHTVEDAVQFIQRYTELGVGGFMLFGVVDRSEKDATGSCSCSDSGPVCELMRGVRAAEIDALLIADACFCEYTDHGHCGVLNDNEARSLDHDATRELLGKQAVVMARNGADIIAPSGMIDGMVAGIRIALDQAGFASVPIMSYCTKFASALYGPFRDAGEGAPKFGDRRTYQMDFARTNEWQLEMQQDLAEGADFLMVKPAMSYLDILCRMAKESPIPVGAYHVSGEYSMIHAAAEKGWLDLDAVALEQLTAIKRAGAGFIITYFSKRILDQKLIWNP